MPSPHQECVGAERSGGRAWLARNGAAVLVAAGAAAATAHGLYEVAEASKVPAGIAWLYPVITDGLGAVAYSATSRLRGKAAGYAWACVVLAAGLSGLAQAVYLAADTVAADPVLRFGVGAWPAIACALVAHLLHLTLTTNQHQQHDAHPDGDQHGGQNDGGQGDGHCSTRGLAVQLDAAAPMAALPAGPVADLGADTDGGEDVASGTAHDQGEHDDGGAANQGGADQDDGDPRVRVLVELLATGADVTGPQVQAVLAHQLDVTTSPRTARRLLAAAREHQARDAVHGFVLDPALDPGRRHLHLLLTPTADGTTNTSSDTDGDPR